MRLISYRLRHSRNDFFAYPKHPIRAKKKVAVKLPIDTDENIGTGLRLTEPVLVFILDLCQNRFGLSSAGSTILGELLVLWLSSGSTGVADIVDFDLLF